MFSCRQCGRRFEHMSARIKTQDAEIAHLRTALTEAKRERDAAKGMLIQAHDKWEHALDEYAKVKADLAAAREVIDRAYEALSTNTVTRPASEWHQEAHVKATEIIGSFLERTALPMPTDDEPLLRIHGDENCYICGKPKISEGSSICSYPHGMIPDKPIDPNHPNGFWSWRPAERVRTNANQTGGDGE